MPFRPGILARSSRAFATKALRSSTVGRHLAIEEVHQMLEQGLTIDLQVQRQAVSHAVNEEGFVRQADLACPCIDLLGGAYGDGFVLLAVHDHQRWPALLDQPSLAPNRPHITATA